MRIEIESILRETDKAYLVGYSVLSPQPKSQPAVSEDWFPKAQAVLDGNVLTVPDWLYKEKVGNAIACGVGELAAARAEGRSIHVAVAREYDLTLAEFPDTPAGVQAAKGFAEAGGSSGRNEVHLMTGKTQELARIARRNLFADRMSGGHAVLLLDPPMDPDVVPDTVEAIRGLSCASGIEAVREKLEGMERAATVGAVEEYSGLEADDIDGPEVPERSAIPV